MSSQTKTSEPLATFVQFAQIWATIKGFGPLPQLHRDICNWIESTDDHPDRCFLGYRYSGKSYLLSLYVAWRLYKNPDFTCLILSGRESLAKKRSDFIRQLIESHPLTTHLVDKRLWRTEEFTVKRPGGADISPSVQIKSCEGSATGNHAHLLIGDDVEDSKLAKTEAGRAKIKDAVDEAVSVTDNYLYIGTPHAPLEETIYTYLEEQGFEFYRRPVRNPDGSPAWPERHPEEWIAKKEKRLSTGLFKSQYLLIPSRPHEVLIDSKNFPTYSGGLSLDAMRKNYSNPFRGGQPIYWINGEKVTDIKAYWDTASGLKGRDNSVVAVCALTVENHIYVADLVKLPPYDFSLELRYGPQLMVVIEAMQRNFCNSIYVEASVLNNLASDLRKMAAEKNIRLAVNETTRGSVVNKQMFIANMIEPLYKTQNLFMADWMLDRSRSDFVKEVESFPKGKHDDHLDAIAGAIHELNPRRVIVGSGAKLLNSIPLNRTKMAVVNRYRPFA